MLREINKSNLNSNKLKLINNSKEEYPIKCERL